MPIIFSINKLIIHVQWNFSGPEASMSCPKDVQFKTIKKLFTFKTIEPENIMIYFK